MSLVQIDDTDRRFDYKDNAWKAGGQTGEFGSTSHSTSTAGALVKFGPFTGISIAVFSTVGTNQTKLHFAVDGDVQNTVLPAQSSSTVKFQQQLYSADNLDPTVQHTLAINLLDAGPFTLDYVLIGGQANTALQSTTRSSSSTIGSNQTTTSNAATLPGTMTTADPSITTATARAVGGTITSSILSTSDSFSAPSPFTITSWSSPFSPATASGDSTASASAGGVPMSATNNGPDAVVIASVASSIILFAIIVVSVLLFLRRRQRRLAHPGRFGTSRKSSDPKRKQRSALHLSIPSSLSLTRSLQRSPTLPMHSNKSSSTPDKHTGPFGISHTAPSFLAEDPNDSPVLDIKQRPVSGATMTTRVTVGTTIDQRVSVPESVYRYPSPETPKRIPVPVPPMPRLPSKSLNPSPTERGASSAPPHYDFGLLGTNPAGTFDTAVFSGYAENDIAGTGTVPSASRPLPHIPTDAKHAHLGCEPGDHVSQMQQYPDTHRYLPVTPSDAETVIHQDGGVRLDPNIQIRPRRELPPPYGN